MGGFKKENKMRMNKQVQQGFTLIELVVVMVILGLLGAVAVPKFMDITADAEAASVKNILGSLRSGLSIKIASGLVNGMDIDTWVYNGSAALKPMEDLLASAPESYIGVRTESAAPTENGVWWDRRSSATDNWVMYSLKKESIITKPDGSAGGGWSSNGRNIINRIEKITDNGSTVGLKLSPTSNYDYKWDK